MRLAAAERLLASARSRSRLMSHPARTYTGGVKQFGRAGEGWGCIPARLGERDKVNETRESVLSALLFLLARVHLHNAGKAAYLCAMLG
jgi:hypothetical protein